MKVENIQKLKVVLTPQYYKRVLQKGNDSQPWPKSLIKPAFLNVSLPQSLVSVNMVLKYWYLHLTKVNGNFGIDFNGNIV